MNRRKFIGSALTAGAAALAAPYILPSGRLFARTGSRRVNHVVLCLFAGGVRNIESVHQARGNLMPALLRGSGSWMPGLDPVPNSPFTTPLQANAALFKEFRYKEGPTGHFNGHTVAITGAYTNTGLNLRENPSFPTIFEYYRKHNSPQQTALNAWWVSNSLGPYPALNFSKDPDYGAKYGANFIAPGALVPKGGLGNSKIFEDQEEATAQSAVSFLNKNFRSDYLSANLGMVNTEEDAFRIRRFIKSLYEKANAGAYNNPMGMSHANWDIYNLLYSLEVLREFTPELMVVNMTSVDVCHQNFTEYCNNLRKVDYGTAWLWNEIQKIPGMKDDTVMIIVPEHGRNLESNSVTDAYGEKGIDHTDDATSREIFCMLLGPSHVVSQNQIIGTPQTPIGQSIDIVPTIANLLGFDVDIPAGKLKGKILEEALV